MGNIFILVNWLLLAQAVMEHDGAGAGVRNMNSRATQSAGCRTSGYISRRRCGADYASIHGGVRVVISAVSALHYIALSAVGALHTVFTHLTVCGSRMVNENIWLFTSSVRCGVWRAWHGPP